MTLTAVQDPSLHKKGGGDLTPPFSMVLDDRR
jgi:hypothetical protein